MHRGTGWAGRAGAWILVVGILVVGILVVAALATTCTGSDRPPAPAQASILQVRGVENVVLRSSPEWEATDLTCPGEEAGGCLAARAGEPVVVLAIDQTKYLLGAVVVDGDDVEEARAYEDAVNKGWTVAAQLSPEGTEALASATRADIGRQIAIVVDGLVVSAPTVQQPVTSGNMIVGGGLSRAEAEGLASTLNGDD